MIQIYHNPRCGKSRTCLAFANEKQIDFQIINYLETPPNYADLEELLKKLKYKPIQLVRTKEKIWNELFKNKLLSDTEIIEAMVSFPILIERPIVIKGNQAIIGRDLEELERFI